MRSPLKNKTTKGKADKTLFLLTCILLIAGLIAVADASAPQAQNYFNDSFYYVKQQILWGGLGFIAMVAASNIHYVYWKKISIYLFMGTLILLVAVLIPGIGSKVLGARRWISIGFFGFQPSEVVKLTLALFFARLCEVKKPIGSYLVFLGITSALIMLQPDLGTTIIVLCIGITQLFVAGVSLVQMGALFGVGGFLVSLLIFFSSYRRERFMTFLKSSTDPLGSSYHIGQVLIALGSGGLFGKGLGQSRQKYLFLPEAATDSVFAIIAEEVGFLGSMLLLALFALFVYRGLRIAIKSRDPFAAVLAAGIVAWIGGQIFLNLSSMIALTPLTGVPLPFFSYGGSSLTMILLGVGILLNISKYNE